MATIETIEKIIVPQKATETPAPRITLDQQTGQYSIPDNFQTIERRRGYRPFPFSKYELPTFIGKVSKKFTAKKADGKTPHEFQKTNVLPKAAVRKLTNKTTTKEQVQVTEELLKSNEELAKLYLKNLLIENFFNFYPRPTKEAYKLAEFIFGSHKKMFDGEETKETKKRLQSKYRSWYPPFSKTVTNEKKRFGELVRKPTLEELKQLLIKLKGTPKASMTRRASTESTPPQTPMRRLKSNVSNAPTASTASPASTVSTASTASTVSPATLTKLLKILKIKEDSKPTLKQLRQKTKQALRSPQTNAEIIPLLKETLGTLETLTDSDMSSLLSGLQHVQSVPVLEEKVKNALVTIQKRKTPHGITVAGVTGVTILAALIAAFAASKRTR